MTQPFRPMQPTLSSSYVERARLYDALEGWRSLRAIVIRAPAGYGKTTLVRGWLESAAPTAIWLSLDERFDEGDMLVRQLALAFDPLVPDLVAAVAVILEDAHATAEHGLDMLLRNVEHSGHEHLLLVLDDLHLLTTAAAHRLLKQLLAHAPANLHLLLLSREPVALTDLTDQRPVEIDVDLLRFTAEEIQRFLTLRGYPPLSDIELRAIVQRTDGWILAVQLAVLSQRTPGDVNGLMANLSSDSRWLSTYLAEEVLSQQPQPIQRLLLTTSILDSFNAALSAQLSRLPNTSELLAQIKDAALFVVGLDGRDEWFSYHHLFREWLRRRLITTEGPESVRALHRRAADWYATAGDLQLAVRHLAAAGDEQAATDLLAERLPTLLLRDPFQVRRWLNQLSPQQQADPRLAVLRCHLEGLLDNRDLLVFVHRAEQALANAALPEGQLRALRAELPIWRAAGHLLRGDFGSADTDLRQNHVESVDLDALALGTRHFMLMHLSNNEGQYAEAERYAEQAVDAYTQADYLAAVVSVRRERAMLFIRLGQSTEANRQFTLIFQQPLDRPFMVREVLTAYHYAIQNSYWQDKLAEARQYHQQATLLAQRLQDDEMLSMLAGLGALHAREESSAPGSEQPGEMPTILGSGHLRLRIQIDLLVQAGRAEEAWRMAGTLGVGLDSDPAAVNSAELRSYLRAYIARGVNLAATNSLLKRAVAQSQQIGARFDELHLLTLRAWQQHKLGRRLPATNYLESAVQLALETGYLRVVLDIPDLLPLLELGGDPPIRLRTSSSDAERTGVVITPQQLAVLKLLDKDFRYQQIAEELRISMNTLETHVRHLYTKLGVRRRAQALARARELGLFD